MKKTVKMLSVFLSLLVFLNTINIPVHAEDLPTHDVETDIINLDDSPDTPDIIAEEKG
jgi:hypothetical protein